MCPLAPFTSLTSADVIVPLIRTSSGKLALVTVIPSWPLVRPTSVLLTVLSPLTSPMSIPALTDVVGSTCEEISVTSVKVTVSVWTSVTLVSGDGHGHAGKGWCPNGSSSRGHVGVAADYVGRKAKYETVAAATVTAFHSRRAVERKVDVEFARCFVTFTRDR
jgi:hypothetical protein